MTVAQHEAEEGWLDAQNQVLEEYLKSKGADTPCQRCGNKQFLMPEHNYGPLVVTYCSKCGHKNEHLVAILLTTDDEEE